jgi:hypothetical protein
MTCEALLVPISGGFIYQSLALPLRLARGMAVKLFDEIARQGRDVGPVPVADVRGTARPRQLPNNPPALR